MRNFSNLSTWFIPAWSGDFRLEINPDDPTRSILTVENPTDADRKRLVPFLAHARERGWMDPLAGVSMTGMSVVHVNAPIREAGASMAAHLFGPEDTVWTALRVSNDTVELVNGTLPFDIAAPQPAPEEKQLPAAPSVQAAATVRAPRLGCPAPAAAARRASEVLRTFCTRREWDCWERRGFIPVMGNASGRGYRVYHRDVAAKLNMGHTVVDDTGKELCMWDDMVPAEEEALALKLALQHREDWVLNVGGLRPFRTRALR